MSYLIRLSEISEGASHTSPALTLRDSQIAGSPPCRLRGLPWRSLQSALLVLDEPDARAQTADWLLGRARSALRDGSSPFDSAAAPKAPFGDLACAHLDCADWEWRPAQARWFGSVRSPDGRSAVHAPLFAFWLEQALRHNPLALSLSPDPKARLPFSFPPPPAILSRLCPIPLQAFQIQRLRGAELDILLFAFDHISELPALPRPDCLPEPIADRLALAARSAGLDGFALLSHRDPEAAASLEALALQRAAAPSPIARPPSRL